MIIIDCVHSMAADNDKRVRTIVVALHRLAAIGVCRRSCAAIETEASESLGGRISSQEPKLRYRPSRYQKRRRRRVMNSIVRVTRTGENGNANGKTNFPVRTGGRLPRDRSVSERIARPTTGKKRKYIEKKKF